MSGANHEKKVLIRPATLDELPSVIRLLATNSRTIRGAMGPRLEPSIETILLERRGQPLESHYVAVTPEGRLVATTFYLTAEMPQPGMAERLSSLRPLGLRGALRYLLLRRIWQWAYRPGPGEVYLDSFVVDPEYRNAGVGRELTMQLIDDTAARGYSRWTVIMWPTAPEPRAIARALGFREIKVRGRYWRPLFGQPMDIVAQKQMSGF